MNNNKYSKPLVSVIIPTRERADTLLFAIRTALDQDSDDYEVIVSDNFSQDNTKEVVQSFNDPRLIYVNSGRRLSMCDNYEFALEHAKGEYVIFIGDDDAIMPGAIDKLQITIKSKPNLVYCWPLSIYTWPKNGQRAFVSYLSPNTSPFEINLKESAIFVLEMRGIRGLTSVYHGAVTKCILDMIRKQTGRVFHSTQPDVFTSFAIPVFSDTAINVGYAVTVTGRSPKANSAVAYDRDSRVNTEKFLQEYGDYKIHPSLFPGIDILANLIPDAILVAMDKFPQFYNGLYFNYNAWWASIILQQAGYFKWDISIKEIIQKRRQIRCYHPFSVLQFLEYCIMCKFAELYRKPAALYRSFLKKNMRFGPFSKDVPVPDNIGDFVKQLADYQKNIIMRKKYLNYHYIARTILSLKKKMLHSEAVRQEKREIIFYSKFIKKGDLCFDVGANIGNKTNIFLKLGAKVIALEPQDFACQKINKLYGDNKNLVVINKGLAEKQGFLELSICEDCNVLSTMSEKWRKEGRFSKDYKWAKTKKVSVDTLDNLIGEYGLPKFCKIDVEEFEQSILKGLTKPIPYISFEFHKEFFDNTKKCIDYLLSLGFTEFNCVIGESTELLFSKWVTFEELYVKLETIEDKDLWGDIYVKFSKD